MAWAAAIPALIGAAASIYGSSKSADAQEDANAQAKEAAQMGIRWRVADAKAAGLHPLFALGGSGATYSPQPVTAFGEGIARAGQDLSRAAQAAMASDEHELKDAQLAAARANATKDLAQAAYYDSLAARERQSGAIAMGPPAMPPAVRDAYVGNLNARNIGVWSAPEVDVPIGGSIRERAVSGSGGGKNIKSVSSPEGFSQDKPNPAISSRIGDRSLTTPQNPMWEQHVMRDNPRGVPFMLALPRSDEGPGETWGELSWYDKAAILVENARRNAHSGYGNYGPGWQAGMSWLADFVYGAGPLAHWPGRRAAAAAAADQLGIPKSERYFLGR